jgi:hypothetical protein
MVKGKTYFVICLVLSTLCLAAGYGMAGKWVGVGIAFITGGAWLLTRKYPDTGLAHGCFVVSICLAVAGLLTGSPPFWMICGSAGALTVWDLALLEIALSGSAAGDRTLRFEKNHLQSLALAVGCGLTAAIVGGFLKFQVPFLVMLLLIGLLVFGFERIWSTINKGGSA